MCIRPARTMYSTGVYTNLGPPWSFRARYPPLAVRTLHHGRRWHPPQFVACCCTARFAELPGRHVLRCSTFIRRLESRRLRLLCAPRYVEKLLGIRMYERRILEQCSSEPAPAKNSGKCVQAHQFCEITASNRSACNVPLPDCERSFPPISHSDGMPARRCEKHTYSSPQNQAAHVGKENRTETRPNPVFFRRRTATFLKKVKV